MDKLNELGFINFWGYTPALNIFNDEDNFVKEKIEKAIFNTSNTNNSKCENFGNILVNKNNNENNKTIKLDINKLIESKKNEIKNETNHINNKVIRILLSNNLDFRHIIKTLNSLNDKISKIKKENKNNKDFKIEIDFYFFETFQENLVRTVLLFYLLLSEEFSNIEKIDMFLEIYGNTLITEKSSNFISNSIPDLSKIIYSIESNKKDETSELVKKMIEIFDFSNLNYKDLDNMKEIIDSYHDKTQFNIEKLREERLRYLFKDRYDFRENLIDWDYQMKTREFVDFMGYNIYKKFRLTGISFEKHNTKYNKPNKTLGSYIPGRSVRIYLN